MNLLFKREQTPGKIARINFKLWAKLEITADEKALMDRYSFANGALVEVIQPNLIRTAAALGFAVFIVTGVVLSAMAGTKVAVVLGLLAGGGAAYWWINEKRETIYVRDLLEGRNFKCSSVIELAKQEARLHDMVYVLRQVAESAKHWDGAETIEIDALPKDEARQLILRLA
ncbi:hypothetical protein [Parasphingorhabdus halotolerans]|uniref:Uncharacterized protein n=1 Tax=Parasphingorhabdus halotolerans TaxID=2725558 RepID=A0A6H2DNC4_9SPHN|nr:hypothetical protein [Parasphingorhabdus halotolerans]QJB69854.1 hypothetical protein HF685_11675 [Parasphingorhabdus halotolerans]